MVWTAYQFAVAGTSLVTCTGNTIIVKWAVRTESVASDGHERVYNHPFVFTSMIFFGEMLDLLWYRLIYIYLKRRKDGSEDRNNLTRGNRDFNPLVLAIPATCELASSACQLIGINLTYASSLQMIKTSVIIFTALFRKWFLKRSITLQQWIGIFVVIFGIGLVFLADFISPRTTPKVYKTHDIIIGDLLVLVGQVFTASQMVVEELLVSARDIQPLVAIGWEGTWGFLIMGVLHVIFYFTPCPPPIALNSRQVVEDVIDASVQISNSTSLIVCMVLFVLTITLCKCAGINLTKEFSCVLRRTFDSLRIIILYGFGLIFFGQKFHYMHPIGFVFVALGVFIHTDLIGMKEVRWVGRKCHCIKPETDEEGGESAGKADAMEKK